MFMFGRAISNLTWGFEAFSRVFQLFDHAGLVFGISRIKTDERKKDDLGWKKKERKKDDLGWNKKASQTLIYGEKGDTIILHLLLENGADFAFFPFSHFCVMENNFRHLMPLMLSNYEKKYTKVHSRFKIEM